MKFITADTRGHSPSPERLVQPTWRSGSLSVSLLIQRILLNFASRHHRLGGLLCGGHGLSEFRSSLCLPGITVGKTVDCHYYLPLAGPGTVLHLRPQEIVLHPPEKLHWGRLYHSENVWAVEVWGRERGRPGEDRPVRLSTAAAESQYWDWLAGRWGRITGLRARYSDETILLVERIPQTVSVRDWVWRV